MVIPSQRSSPGGTPRWRTLVALTAAVLVLHLWGLGVDLTELGSGMRDSPARAVSDSAPLPAGQGAPAAASAPEPAQTSAIEVTQVRWVPVPAAAPATARRAAPVAMERKRKAPVEPSATPRPTPPASTGTAALAPAIPSETEPVSMPAGDPQAASQAPPPTRPDAVEVAQADMPSEPASPAASAISTPSPTSALPPSQPPASTRLSYDIEGVIKGLTYRASGTFDWTLAAGRYEARTEMSMFLVGSRVQTSVGTVGPDGLRPERFSDKRRSEVATHFEQVAGRIRFSGNAPEALLMPGAQDRLSLFMQLAGLLQARPHAAGDVIEFQVAGTGDAEPWRFEVGELQDLDLPAGTVNARWIRRLPRKPHDSTVEMWLAPSMNHLPVRLRISQANGDVADQRLARLP